MCGGCCGDSVADEEAGEIPKAFIVLKEIATRAGADGIRVESSSTIQACSRNRIHRTNSKIGIGKILRRTLVARERAKLV